MKKCSTCGCNALVAKHEFCARCKPRPRHVDRRATHHSAEAEEAKRKRKVLAGLPVGWEGA